MDSPPLLRFAQRYKLPVIWFALPSIPQPSVNATAWVAQSPLVTFLELQAVLLLQLVFVVREALKIYHHNF